MAGISNSITVALFFLASALATPVDPPAITAPPLLRRDLQTIGWYADGVIGGSTICMLHKHSQIAFSMLTPPQGARRFAVLVSLCSVLATTSNVAPPQELAVCTPAALDLTYWDKTLVQTGTAPCNAWNTQLHILTFELVPLNLDQHIRHARTTCFIHQAEL